MRANDQNVGPARLGGLDYLIRGRTQENLGTAVHAIDLAHRSSLLAQQHRGQFALGIDDALRPVIVDDMDKRYRSIELLCQQSRAPNCPVRTRGEIGCDEYLLHAPSWPRPSPSTSHRSIDPCQPRSFVLRTAWRWATAARLDRQRDAGHGRDFARPRAGGDDDGSGIDRTTRPKCDLVRSQTNHLVLDVVDAPLPRLASEALHQGGPIEPAFVGRAMRGERHALASRATCSWRVRPVKRCCGPTTPSSGARAVLSSCLIGRRWLSNFPEDARRQVGTELRRVQEGLEPFDWKTMTAAGSWE